MGANPYCTAVVPISRIASFSKLETEPHLKLEHPRRVYVCERRDRVRSSTHRYQLTERNVWNGCVAKHRLAAAQEVPVIEDIESLKPDQDAGALGGLDTVFDEDREF